MPMETDRLKLPLPLGNENVTRESINAIFEKIDAGAATQEDLETLREAVSKMDIPDASLTQKGKVQLSSKTDGTSETLAATEKALNDVRQGAISKNRASNKLPNGSGELGMQGWINLDDYSRWTAGNVTSERPSAFFNGNHTIGVPNGGRMQATTYLPMDVQATLSADFLNIAGVAGQIVIDLINHTSGNVVASISNDALTVWHRKSVSFRTPTGSGATYRVMVRIITGLASSSARQVSRIMVAVGEDTGWNQDANDSALLDYINTATKRSVWGPII